MSAETSDPYLKISNLTKNFGNFTALRDISLEVFEKRIHMFFLGPSGCGKTTLLRAIAGLDIQTAGEIHQKGKDISALPPSERDFRNCLFNSYALFPNLTILKNVAYGLENMKKDKAYIAKRVDELLELVGMPETRRQAPSPTIGWSTTARCPGTGFGNRARDYLLFR